MDGYLYQKVMEFDRRITELEKKLKEVEKRNNILRSDNQRQQEIIHERVLG